MAPHHDQIALQVCGQANYLSGGQPSARPGLHRVFQIRSIDDLACCLQGVPVASQIKLRRHRTFHHNLDRGDVEKNQPGPVIPGE